MSKKLLQASVGFAISGLFLFLAFRSIDLAQLGAALGQVRWVWVLPFVAVTLAQMWWRAVRWRVLLAPAKDVGPRRLFGPLMIGMAFNSIFPLRAGEVARPLALAKTEDIPFPAGFASVVLERILDALALLLLFAVVPYVLPFNPDVQEVWDGRRQFTGWQLNALLSLGMALPGAALLAVGYWQRKARPELSGATYLVGGSLAALAALTFALQPFDQTRTIVLGQVYELNAENFRAMSGKLSLMVGVLLGGALSCLAPPVRKIVLFVIERAPLLSPGIRGFLSGLFHKFTDGFSSLRSPKAVALACFHSLGIWVLGAFSFLVMSWGFPEVEMTMAHAVAFLVITAIAISLPSAPGFWGLYEVGGIVSMLVLGLVPATPEGRALALGYTMVCHFFQWAPITVIGLFYAGAVHMKPGQLDAPEAPK